MKQFDDQRDQERLAPMDPKEYRLRQEKGMRPELVNANVQPPSVGELMAEYDAQAQQRQQQQQEEAQQAEAEEAAQEAPLTQEELLRQEALKELDRSQMPAVAADEGGRLTKTIEHYTFADGEDTASFYVHFDKDLWDGASKYISETQISVDSRPTSLEIRLKGVPVNERSLQTLADWKLSLSPLFSRVEPLMTAHKVRNGKLSVKLAKAKNAPWKKGVKYS